MNILVCDDDPVLVEILNIKLRELEFTDEIALFTSPHFSMDNIYVADVAILDINIGEHNGVELARKIKSVKPNIEIVFITAYPDYAVESFEVHPYGYILKPLNFDRIYDLLTELNCRLVNNSVRNPAFTFKFKSRGEFFLIPYDEIILFETISREVVMTTEDKEYSLSLTLQELEKKLPETLFYRTHASFIVNISKVKRVFPSGVKVYSLEFNGTDKIANISCQKYKDFLKKTCLS